MLMPISAPSHAVDIGTDFDSFGGVMLAADATGAPYVGGADLVLESATFDPTSFTLQPGEGFPDARNACLGSGGVSRAGKTGWIKFDPDVDGRIYAQAITPGYDSVLLVRNAQDHPTNGTVLTETTTGECSDAVVGAGIETTAPESIAAGRSYYVQVGPKCTDNECTTTATPGPTSIRVYFFPDDADTDGVADTLDACAATPAGTRVNAEGCPDQDGDSITDTADNCPTLAGVSQASPYNGCPPGPTPPFGTNPFVVIIGSSGSIDNTNTTNVTLQLNWPQGAQQAFIGNGDGTFEQRALTAYAPWALRQATKPEARQVTVRYIGPGIDVNVDAVINLDPIAPQVPKRASVSVRKGWATRLSATDQGSGVRKIEALGSKGKVIRTRVICAEESCKNKVLESLVTKSRPRAVRVTDAAGNITRVNVRAARCPSPEFAVWPKPAFTIFKPPVCFRAGDRCNPVKFKWQETEWRCTGGYVVPSKRGS
jgi:hypothetical protein